MDSVSGRGTPKATAEADRAPAGLVEEDLPAIRGRLQSELLRGSFWLVTCAAAILALRELVAGGPVLAPALGFVLGGSALVASFRGKASHGVGVAFFAAVIVLITRGALELGGAAGSALSLAFIPGLLASLVLGPAWGWGACVAMLGSFGWLFATTSLPTQHDRLRFMDEIAMTVFATALGHALMRGFTACENEVARRRALLGGLREQRDALADSVYAELEPLAAELVTTLEVKDAAVVRQAELGGLLDRFVRELTRAKALSRLDEAQLTLPADPDRRLRRNSMRVWLRLGAVFMSFVVVRNLIVGVAFAPSLVSLAACAGFDLWLSRPRALAHLEATALAIGVVATGPMIAHIQAYGAGPSSPPVVVTPATVLFTTLLSRGPAAWAVLLLNVGVVAWTGIGKHPTLVEFRLLGDVALSFVVLILALGCVFELRRRYTQTMLDQGRQLSDTIRQQRRLAGTLFHDVSNHVQSLVFFTYQPTDQERARSLARRVQRLVTMSKGFLSSTRPSEPPVLEAVPVEQALASLQEAFAPRVSAKDLALETPPASALRVRAQPDLLIESVLGNLLSNAIKFSPRGSRISITAEEAGPLVRLAIRDAGPGIAPEVLHELEHDGTVSSHDGTAGEKGQGYGLKLAREHLLRMGGRLELVCPSGGGTEGVVWLPNA